MIKEILYHDEYIEENENGLKENNGKIRLEIKFENEQINWQFPEKINLHYP